MLTARGSMLKIHLHKNNRYIKNFVVIHVTTIKHTEIVSRKDLFLKSNWWPLWTTYLFYQKRVYVYF